MISVCLIFDFGTKKDSRGRTARDTASKRNHDKILAMLNPAKQMRLMQVRHWPRRCALCFTLIGQR